jgi:hypothetical protein
MREIRKEKLDDKRDLILTKYYNASYKDGICYATGNVKFEIAIFVYGDTENHVEYLETEDELKYANQYFDNYIKENR